MDKLSAGEKKIKRKIFWDKVSFIFVAFFLALSAVFSITLIYQKTYFEVKWVNGQSMYPTFNKDATDRYGNPKGKEGLHANNGDKNLDCVIWDGHEQTLNKLERFDIVINDHPNSGKDLIKRIIVMPGETFYFGNIGDDKGKLYIANSSGEFEYVAQPIDDEYLQDGDYGDYTVPTTLEKNQYFICGDNRGHSSDSRSFGPVKKKDILGLVVAYVGHCDATLDSTNQVTYTNLRIGMPRFIK